MSKLCRTKREDLGRSIGEVASSTRIKANCLAAIEEEDYDNLPVEVYARGYIKEYAKYLSLPIEDVLSPYEKYLEMKKELKEKRPVTSSSDRIENVPEKVKEEIHGPRTDEAFCKDAVVEPEPSRTVDKTEAFKTFGNKILWKGFLLAIVIIAIAYQFISSRNAEQESRVAPMTQQTETPKEALPNAVTPPTALPLPETAETKTAEMVPPKKRHNLIISAEDTSWVQVIMDGSEKKEALMKHGETLKVEADKTIRVVIGNAGGVSLKFDGKDLPAGKKGEVLRLTLPETPKVEKPVQDSLPTAPQKPSASVRPESDATKKLPDEKAMPTKLPDEPASTSKP